MVTINKTKDSALYTAELNRIDRTRKILYWNEFFGSKDFGFPEGMEPFYPKCEQFDCYVTHNKYWIPVEYFDAVIFHGPEYELNQGFPETRSQHQRYIYFSMESPANRPVSSDLDKFFNWTMTYRWDTKTLHDPLLYLVFNLLHTKTRLESDLCNIYI